MSKSQKLAELASLVAKMSPENIAAIRAYAISVRYERRSWVAVHGAELVDRLVLRVLGGDTNVTSKKQRR